MEIYKVEVKRTYNSINGWDDNDIIVEEKYFLNKDKALKFQEETLKSYESFNQENYDYETCVGHKYNVYLYEFAIEE